MCRPTLVLRLLVPIVASLLLSAPSHAATAWLLWVEKTDSYREEGKQPQETTSWVLIGAEVTREACVASQAEYLEETSRAEAGVKITRKNTMVSKTQATGTTVSQISLLALCVPDTIDPRPLRK